jgi:hypothetical protein
MVVPRATSRSVKPERHLWGGFMELESTVDEIAEVDTEANPADRPKGGFGCYVLKVC